MTGARTPTAHEMVARVLREQGLDDHGASPHSWRCEFPDRYPGYCKCVQETADAIVEALASLAEVVAAEESEK